ncbi:MAG: hypothetical protein M1820_001716 [Bogoriella megaspora]|nr:MAG: hypothetical protein M1820_001716 [Bogoriella megaspora]
MSASLTSTLKEPSIFVEKLYINGAWVSSNSGQSFEVSNPADDVIIGTCPESNVRSMSGRQRGRIITKIFNLIVEAKEDIGKIITAENGKAKADAEGEALFAASFFEWFGEEASRIYGDVIPHSNPTFRTRINKEPVGVCGLITVWNFTLTMGARKISAALAAGCTIVLKSDGLTPFSSNALAILSERAGLPKGVFNVVTSLKNTPEIDLALCQSKLVKKISFTGSTRVGKLLMKQSSDTLKKLSLELGGNAPLIVFDDADLETAVASTLISKFKVTGQTCVCATRIYVQEGIYDRYTERLVEEVGKFKFGDGKDFSVTHGPLTTGTAKVEEHIKDAVSKGYKILLGGNALPKLGRNFHELTIPGDTDDAARILAKRHSALSRRCSNLSPSQRLSRGPTNRKLDLLPMS